MHEVKETGLIPKSRRDDKLFIERAQFINRKKWWPLSQGEHEVTYSLDVLTWTVEKYGGPADLDSRNSWKASRGPACVVGTADWVGDLLGTVHVDDLKTGRHLPACGSPPMLLYGTCALLDTGNTDLALSMTHFPRYPKTTPPQRHWYHENEGSDGDGQMARDLVEFKETLRLTYAEVRRLVAKKSLTAADVHPGPDACIWCPSKIACSKLLQRK